MATTVPAGKKVNRLNIGVKTDRFDALGFDHLEYWTLDAKSVMKALKVGIGMELVAQSMHETANHIYSSYVLKTGNIKWVVSSPYLSDTPHPVQTRPHPNYDPTYAKDWVGRHGNGVAVIGIRVANAKEAYERATGVGEADQTGWAKGYTPPTEIKGEKGSIVLAEIFIYGETILRFMEYKDGYDGAFLPGYKAVKDPAPVHYGIVRMDHVVGNVPHLDEVVANINKWLGFHVFAAFTKEQIQTEWTSLNSTVMSNNYETILLPLNEPVSKKKQSQIEEFLKAYNGPGVQHIALFATDVISTVEQMMTVSHLGGFEFIPTPPTYYDEPEIQERMKKHLSPEMQERAKKIGLLVDEDDEGVLLQIFTKPLFDRPTIFVEIIQRICNGELVEAKPVACGGFGSGNFRALFMSIERLQAERGLLLDAKS